MQLERERLRNLRRREYKTAFARKARAAGKYRATPSIKRLVKSFLFVCKCESCGKVWFSTRKRATCGQDLCYSRAYYLRNRARLIDLSGRASPRTFKCGECNEVTTVEYGDMRAVFCSDKCSAKFGKRQRKAKLRCAVTERFHPREIYTRDRFICQLCGGMVNTSVHHSHNDAPTLDHVIPVVAGGSHTRANVQTAHRICNSRKSDRLLPPMVFAGGGSGAERAASNV